jgi:beta-aspartyl-peptidase (threonine type)
MDHATDAVEAAIQSMEASGIFDAGLGSVLNLKGRVEMDAALMTHELQVGAVAGLTRTAHPIAVARQVMERTPHVLLAGPGADRFARALGFPPVRIRSPRRWAVYQDLRQRLEESVRSREKANSLDPMDPARPDWWPRLKTLVSEHPELLHGTVGAVALDARGRLTAGTSTGGITLKLEGRVSDSCLPGCGTYADRTVGVSCTGTGEVIIRHTLARSLAEALKAPGMGLDRAVRRVLRPLPRGTAGLIALDRKGHFGWGRNTENLAFAYRSDRSHSPVFRMA